MFLCESDNFQGKNGKNTDRFVTIFPSMEVFERGKTSGKNSRRRIVVAQHLVLGGGGRAIRVQAKEVAVGGGSRGSKWLVSRRRGAPP